MMHLTKKRQSTLGELCLDTKVQDDEALKMPFSGLHHNTERATAKAATSSTLVDTVV